MSSFTFLLVLCASLSSPPPFRFTHARALIALVFSFLPSSHCMETAQYLRDKITEAGLTCRLNDLSSTVVLERPMDDKFIKRWQLACEEDIAHVVVMPNVTKVKIDKFVEELVECKEKHGRWTPARNDSPLVKLQSSAWGGSYVAPSVGTFKESF